MYFRLNDQQKALFWFEKACAARYQKAIDVVNEMRDHAKKSDEELLETCEKGLAKKEDLSILNYPEEKKILLEEPAIEEMKKDDVVLDENWEAELAEQLAEYLDFAKYQTNLRGKN